MAATAATARLTEAHRFAQSRLGAQIVTLLLAAWPLLDPKDVDRTVERWLRVAVPLVAANHRTSSTLAANYLAAFRTLELGADVPAAQPVLAELDRAALVTSLTVTGPVAVKRAMTSGLPWSKALENAQLGSARAAMRHALNGGRDTIIDTVGSDRRAVGWARATSGKACAFCAMLASRGPVYKSAASAGQGRRFHDSCHCAVEPVYRADADWPAGARQYRDLWDQAKAGKGPDETTANVFRRLLADGQ